MLTRREALAALSVLAGGSWNSVMGNTQPSWLEDGKFCWTASPPLIGPVADRDDPCHAIKDPSVVFHEKHWHIFATIRSRKRTHQIEYLSFADWDNTAKANRVVLQLTDGYFFALPKCSGTLRNSDGICSIK
jgi:endo-1,4-beta-xylanase